MGTCNVCGCFALGSTTCNLCALGKTPANRTVDELAKTVGDRHRLPDPKLFPDLWVDYLIQTRVVDLFKTLSGLPGHWMQIQAAVNSARQSIHFYEKGTTTSLGRDKFTRLAISIINVADDSGFDFPTQELRFNNDMGHLRILKSRGRLVVQSKPTGSIKLRSGIQG